jgi:molybdopterin converting factor small subunit
MKVKLTGIAADLYGSNELEVNGISRVDQLNNSLKSHIKGLDNYTYKISVNNKLAPDELELSEQDQVIVFNPFAGG